MDKTLVIFTLWGDRSHPVIRNAQWLRRRFPFLKKYIGISLWDGYSFQFIWGNPHT